ncbi:MAG: hypothetical protein HC806_10130 [Anaerolineae bacterium]|nr:hypothetical protein [Anaerolineae bacterium]
MVLLGLGLLLPSSQAQAVHDLFELGPGISGGADIVGDSNPGNGLDWADIFDANGNVNDLGDGIQAVFALDDLSSSALKDRTIFATSNKIRILFPVGGGTRAMYQPKTIYRMFILTRS